MKVVLQIILFFLTLPALSQDTTYVKNYKLGHQVIRIYSTCYSPCSDSISFINLHDNENTSIEAAEAVLPEFGATLMQLKHKGDRNIDIKFKGKLYTFDPNRIYTKAGIKNSLSTLSRYNAEVAKSVGLFAEQVLRTAVNGKKLIVALHNNTDENYSILSYQENGAEAQNASRIFINPEMDADDFIFTTVPAIFDSLQARNINVVLQNNKTVQDDGSLSVYASQHNIPYINVEAEEGHLDEQKKMLQAICELIKNGW